LGKKKRRKTLASKPAQDLRPVRQRDDKTATLKHDYHRSLGEGVLCATVGVRGEELETEDPSSVPGKENGEEQ